MLVLLFNAAILKTYFWTVPQTVSKNGKRMMAAASHMRMFQRGKQPSFCD